MINLSLFCVIFFLPGVILFKGVTLEDDALICRMAGIARSVTVVPSGYVKPNNIGGFLKQLTESTLHSSSYTPLKLRQACESFESAFIQAVRIHVSIHLFKTLNTPFKMQETTFELALANLGVLRYDMWPFLIRTLRHFSWLQSLDLSYNHLTDSDLEPLLKQLYAYPQLKSLTLNGNALTFKVN